MSRTKPADAMSAGFGVVGERSAGARRLGCDAPAAGVGIG